MSLIPAELSYSELVEVLKDMIDHIESGDSMEGFIQYALPDFESSAEVMVTASYRVGNSMGQGGIRMIGHIDNGPVSTSLSDYHDDVSEEPLIDPDCRDGKHQSCIGGPCECWCHV